MASPSSPQQPLSAGLSADSMLRPPMASVAKRDKKPTPKRKVAEDPRRTPRRNSLRRAKNSTEELRARTRQRGGSASTVDATTAGRSFTVGNINNGFIYLRPVVRPGNQRNRPPPPDPFVFPPVTPPNSAPLDSLEPKKADNAWRETVYSDTEVPDAKKEPVDSKSAKKGPRARPTKPTPAPKRAPHVRSHSFSSTHEQTPSPNADRTFRVVIERPSAGRPKTAESESLPQLQVPIPHYRLGTPRFSARGTAILRSSIYTRTSATEDFRSSIFSYTRGDNDRLFPSPMGHHSSYLSRRHSEAYPGWKRNTGMTSGGFSSSRTSLGPVEPQLYDIYATNPEDPSVVRFSSTGEIIAATPSRLVAHITSPSFVDYDLLGHFFLTFRAFLSVNDLLTYLIARLRWAVNRTDDFGRIVRVRTFVALRHWILNYFVDDFLPDYHFRDQFCTLINSLYDELRNRDDGGAGDLKIVSELKRCWRRKCAEYWEPTGAVQEHPESPISPGGSRPSMSSRDATQPAKPKKQVTLKRSKPEVLRLGTAEAAANKHFEWFRETRHVPQQSLTSANISSQRESQGMPPLSPASELSMQVLSCSIPMRALTRWEPDQDIPLFPHPVPHQALSPPPYATSARPGPRGHGHKRSGSFSDALRDSRGPLPLRKNSLKETTISPAAMGPGSLVRGAMFQPGSPYIDIKYPNFISRPHLDMADVSAAWANSKGLATSPGMKRILGSVRRALSSKQPPGHGSPVAAAAAVAATEHMPGAQPNRSSQPGTVDTGASSRPSQHRKKLSREHGQVRIDLLADRVGDSFRQAIVEELELEKQGRRSLLASNIGNMHSFIQNPPAQENNTLKPDIARINSSVTQGSRSIVIMDDTGAPPLPMMSGALAPPPPAPVVYNFSRPLTSRGTGASLRGQRSTYQGQTEHMRQASNANSSFDVGVGSQGQASLSSGAQQLSSRERSSSRLDRPHSSTRSQSVGSLRRYASYNSSVLKPPPVVGTSAAATSRAVTASSEDDPFHLERVPVNRLRRRPGGDLRAVDNVHDLETPPQQRRHSAGSISVRSQSFASSAPVVSAEVAPLNLGRRQDKTVSIASADEVKKPLSLMATHSSQPNLRPSFEAEVAKLAALPDDDDDGGVESALMKLEGRYEKRSPETKSAPTSPLDSLGAEEVLEGVSMASKTPSPGPALGLSIQDELDVVQAREVSRTVHQRNFDGSQSAIESEDSYNSIPLLQRGLSDATITWRNRPSQQGVPPVEALRGASPDSSIEYVNETDSMKRIRPGETMPRPTDAHASFEPNDDKHLTKDMFDLAHDGEDSGDESDGVRSFFSDEPANLDRESGFFHPLRHPPTPPLTAEPGRRHGSPSETITQFQKGLPTPGLSPVSKGAEPVLKSASPPPAPVVPLPEPTISVSKETKAAKRSSQLAHLCFIMAYNSEVIAQQFTIIEKDALDEIDWKELIELRWKQSSPLVKDWVEYLRTQEPQGVDVVIARFNMVVKWAVSEILLTENIEERAKTIIKYIHIAQHTRRLRNYATMYQITIALLSSDVARLSKTWEYVPAAEKQTLRQLEELIQPVRNFHNLRVEMETASLEEGCIPFVGIYTRDLVYNGQKPEFIGRSHNNGGEWLVNFERCHVAATIVKSLLRLLEASSNYKFTPDPSIISKCLWLAALTDEEIVSLSKKVE